MEFVNNSLYTGNWCIGHIRSVDKVCQITSRDRVYRITTPGIQPSKL